jgi:hypothetical protein
LLIQINEELPSIGFADFGKRFFWESQAPIKILLSGFPNGPNFAGRF